MDTTKIKKNLEKIIIDDKPEGRFCLKSFLLIVSAIYGGAVKLRRTFYQKGFLKSKRLPCVVISIGNLTVGGTGKTPMTLYIAGRIKQLGYTVGIISRGYKGGAEKKGGIVSDGRNVLMTPEDAGDEPFMMASKLRDVPVIVGQKRFKAGMLAVRHFDPDVLVLDDAFQHVKLWRDIDLVLLDYRRPFGNGFLLPRGCLREPIFSLLRADALILTRYNNDFDSGKTPFWAELESYVQGKPIFRASHVPYKHKVIKGEDRSVEDNFSKSLAYDSNLLQGRRVFLFSGIANHRDFHKTVESLGCVVTGFQEFPDHYQYTDTDVKHIIRSAEDAGAECLVTTEKDYVRIDRRILWPVDLVVLGIDSDFGDDETAFNTFLQNRLERLILN